MTGIAWIYVSTHKKELIQQFSEQVSEKINGKVTMADVDITFFKSFPRMAVHASDISVTDSMYQSHKHPFFQAKELFITINIIRLIKKESPLSGIKVKNGSFYLYTDTSGYSNAYMLKSKKDPAGGPKKTSEAISLKHIWLNNIRFILSDLKREKLIDFDIKSMKAALTDGSEKLEIQTDIDMLVNDMAFNIPNGSFLKGAIFESKFSLDYGKLSQQLSFTKINTQIGKEDFVLTGNFDLGDKNPQFKLIVETKDANYDNIKKLLPVRIQESLSKAWVDAPVDAITELQGPLNQGEPLINASWKVKNTTLKTIFMDFEKASFIGKYTNEVVPGLPRKDPNSILVINDFSGSWHGLPITSGKIEILDLRNPILTCDLQSKFALKKLNELINSSAAKLLKGDADISLRYKGPVEKNAETFALLNGFVNFKNAEILYAPRNVTLRDVNGRFTFSNSDLNIENLSAKVLSNNIVMNGTATKIFTLFNTDPNNVRIKYHVYSPSLQVGEFIYLLQSTEQKVSQVNNDATFSQFSKKLDQVLQKSRIDLDLKADKVYYKKFTASGVVADFTILQDLYEINSIRMNAAGGNMTLKGKVVTPPGKEVKANIDATLSSIDVKKLFYAFDNFGQDGISFTNLKGNLSAITNVSISLTKDGAVIPASARGVVDFSLRKGSLDNFEPMKKMQKFVFKNRNFDNIDFAELKNKLTLRGGEIEIPRMEIQSSVLTLFVEGLFSDKGNTDISIQVPLNNLKKRDDDFIPENIGTDKKGGRSIYLRGQPGSDGNVNFKLDLFKKYFKEKGIEE